MNDCKLFARNSTICEWRSLFLFRLFGKFHLSHVLVDVPLFDDSSDRNAGSAVGLGFGVVQSVG